MGLVLGCQVNSGIQAKDSLKSDSCSIDGEVLIDRGAFLWILGAPGTCVDFCGSVVVSGNIKLC